MSDFYIFCVCLQVFKTLTSPQDLKAAGFRLEFYDKSEKADAVDVCSGLFMAEKAKCTMMCKGALQVVRFRALSQEHYTMLPPQMFVGLLGSADRQVAALLKCKEAWDTIQLIEQNRFKYIQLDRLWHNLPFAKWEVVREVLTLLSEFSFQWVPPPVQRMLNTIFKSWGTSLINELGFREIRARAKEASNGNISATTAWHSLATSKLMEQFGRRHCFLLVCL